MITSFNVFGLTFHVYGLIIGIAVVVGIWLLDVQFKRAKLPTDCLWKLLPIILFGALLGARLWHVISDWQLYVDQPMAVLYVWRGGLSIIGALGVGLLVLWLVGRIMKKTNHWCHGLSVLSMTDALAFVLPVGQAIGRLGNWVNQELYGPPTNLPWKIYVEPINRLSEYSQFSYYHPLFAYEAILLSVFAICLWLSQTKYQQLRLGTGIATLAYLAYFGVTRFCLEFLRLQKPGLTWGSISINQLLVLLVGLISAWLLIKAWRQHDA